MAKRFTDTDKWKRQWFCELDPKAKLVWFYILDMCDHRGVWFSNFKLLSTQIGFKVSESQFKTWFGDKIQFFDGDKFFIRSFVDFQYGDLNPKNNAHLGVISLVQKLSTIEPLNSPSGGAQDKEEDKDKENVLGGCGGNSDQTPKSEKFGPRELAAAWNERMSKVKSWTGTRSIPLVDLETFGPGDRWDMAKARLTQIPSRDYWTDIFERLSRSPFGRGKDARGDWLMNFEFAIRPETHSKVLGGEYGCTPGKPKTIQTPLAVVERSEDAEAFDKLTDQQRSERATEIRNALSLTKNIGNMK